MKIFVRLVSILLKGLLALFPSGYRLEYGDEHAWVLRLALAEAAENGGLPLLHFIACEVRGVPLALLQAYQNEWRLRMNAFRQPSIPATESLEGSQYLWFLLPFIFLLVYSLSWLISEPLSRALALVLLLLMLGGVIAGVIKRLPLWTLPSLGLVISLFDLVFFNSLPEPTPGLIQLKAALWTSFMPARMLYAMIHDFIFILPGILLLVGLALLSTRLPVFPAFQKQLAQDGTRLAFILYSGNLITPFLFDDYRGRGPYDVLFLLVLAGGVWLYLRAARPSSRLAALMVATLLSGLVLTLGVYLLYPSQEWVISGNPAGFPRWWESLYPLLNTLVLLLSLGLMAVIGPWLSGSARPETANL